MDSKGRLWTLAGAEWDPGMDWLGGLVETEFGEVVRLEEWEWSNAIKIDQAGEIRLCIRLTAYNSAT